MSKIYLILGASSDLGVAYIKDLLQKEKDITVYAHYARNAAVLEEFEGKVIPVQADLSNPEEVQKLICHVTQREKSPSHIISFVADTYRYLRFADWDAQKVQRDMQIQVYALAEILKKILPSMVEAQYGKIAVMLSSCTLGEPPSFLSGYTTVKYALLGLIKSIAAEYGKDGININGLSPAMIETKFVKTAGRKIREMNAELSPRHRNLEVSDVIPAIRYLMSDEAEFVNGENLNLSGRGI